MTRLAALLSLTAAFAPAAVMGALPIVVPVVVTLLAAMLLLTGQDTATIQVERDVREQAGAPTR